MCKNRWTYGTLKCRKCQRSCNLLLSKHVVLSISLSFFRISSYLFYNLFPCVILHATLAEWIGHSSRKSTKVPRFTIGSSKVLVSPLCMYIHVPSHSNSSLSCVRCEVGSLWWDIPLRYTAIPYRDYYIIFRIYYRLFVSAQNGQDVPGRTGIICKEWERRWSYAAPENWRVTRFLFSNGK